MAFLKKINSKAKTAANTGFGDNASNYGGRFLNKNGTANIKRTGIGFLERYSWYHSMLAMPGMKFFLVILLFFIIVNFIFAVIYYFLGVEHLGGLTGQTKGEEFLESFFFSAQTFTTVGYGRISPVGFTTSAISAFQALVGLLSFAVATGLMYARFSKPTAYIKFSHNALVAPFKGGTALMMRLAPFKNTTLSEAEVKLTLAMMVEEEGKFVNRFYPLELQLDKINTLSLNWTLVHPINEDSPLSGFTRDDFKNNRGEFIVFLRAFDDMFSNTVITRGSYTFNEVVYGAAFNPMYSRDEENSLTILNLNKLNDFREAGL